tara:strand:+ start:202 stop:450 length:249 start_codon:yes stop_codon:yes gene_type:complete
LAVPTREAAAAMRVNPIQTKKVFRNPVVKALNMDRSLASVITDRVGGCPNDPMVPVTTAVDTAMPTTFPEFLTKFVNEAITP